MLRPFDDQPFFAKVEHLWLIITFRAIDAHLVTAKRRLSLDFPRLSNIIVRAGARALRFALAWSGLVTRLEVFSAHTRVARASFTLIIKPKILVPFRSTLVSSAENTSVSYSLLTAPIFLTCAAWKTDSKVCLECWKSIKQKSYCTTISLRSSSLSWLTIVVLWSLRLEKASGVLNFLRDVAIALFSQ